MTKLLGGHLQFGDELKFIQLRQDGDSMRPRGHQAVNYIVVTKCRGVRDCCGLWRSGEASSWRGQQDRRKRGTEDLAKEGSDMGKGPGGGQEIIQERGEGAHRGTGQNQVGWSR